MANCECFPLSYKYWLTARYFLLPISYWLTASYFLFPISVINGWVWVLLSFYQELCWLLLSILLFLLLFSLNTCKYFLLSYNEFQFLIAIMFLVLGHLSAKCDSSFCDHSPSGVRRIRRRRDRLYVRLLEISYKWLLLLNQWIHFK